MNKALIEQLYREKILPENRSPFHFLKKSDAPVVLPAYNPMCGDKYELYPELNELLLLDLHFHGIGCAVSKASASLMIRELTGKDIKEAHQFCVTFLHVLEGQASDKTLPEPLKILAELRNFGGRMDCIKLSWLAMNSYLSKLSAS